MIISAILAACSGGPSILEDGSAELPGHVSIAYLKSLYQGRPVRIEQPFTISGQVVSNYGSYRNHYKTIVIEDQTGGIEIKVDKTDLDCYPYGCVLTVKCHTLTLGSYGGVIQLGTSPGSDAYQVGYIPDGDMLNYYITMTTGNGQRPPAELFLQTLSSRWLSCHVRINNVQVIQEQAGLTWGDPQEEYFTLRYLVNPSADTLAVRINSSSRLTGVNMPQGSGAITGILGIFNGRYQLTIMTPAGDMNSERFEVIPRD